MLRSIKQLYGDKLLALDGEIGSIKDFYFEDRKWVVRYIVVDTGNWLSGRIVLIAPQVFSNFDQDGGPRAVSLTQKQIQDSPDYDTQKPISRQYEADYYNYYNLPGYWRGEGNPSIEQQPMIETHAPIEIIGAGNLRSTNAITNYVVESNNGPIGYVSDFVINQKNWSICHLVVQTGSWYSSKEIVISPQDVDHISYEESKVFLTSTGTKEAILKSPEHHLPPWAFTEEQSKSTELDQLIAK